MVEVYTLDKKQEQQLRNQEVWQNGFIKVELEKKPESPAATETIRLLARKVAYLDDNTLENIQKLIQNAVTKAQAEGEEHGM